MLATEVLAAHHRELHQLVRALSDTPRHDAAGRRRGLDTLMGELVIHDRIEDEMFYPDMAAVSAVVPTLHAEQRQIVDQLSVLLRSDPATQRFEEELGLFQARFEHHAFLEEETRMFPEVLRTADRAHLERIGDRLCARLEALRRSRLLRIRLRLKRGVLRLL
jgi:hypothetical protein